MKGEAVDLIAYIPARSGSKRIPRKNVKLLGGKPVICHVIKAIQRSGLAKAVVVSTDDRETKRICEAAGALVLDLRDPKLSDDRTNLMELLKKDVPRYLKAAKLDPKNSRVLFALATAALVTEDVYREAYQTFVAEKARILVATSGFANSPFRALVRSDQGGWVPLFPKILLKRSQELPEAQVDAGLFYILDYPAMTRVKGHWFSIPKSLCCYPVPEKIAVDVDTHADWLKLEQKYKESRGTKHSRP